MAARTGLAIGSDRMFAFGPRAHVRATGPAQVAEISIEAPASGGEWPAYEAALDQLDLNWKGVRVGVALLPPLARAKVLRPPPVRARELNSLVKHGIRRYFPGSSDKMMAAAVPLGAGKRTEMALAACAPAWLPACVEGALRSRGGRVETVVPATAALVSALERRAAEVRDGRVIIVACGQAWFEAVTLHDGVVRMILPLDRAALESDDLDRARSRVLRVLNGFGPGDEPDRILLCGSATNVETARAAIEGAGAPCPVSALSGPDESEEPEALAAAGALPGSAERGPELVPPIIHRRRARRARRRGAALSAAAIVFAVVAGLAHARGLNRDLAVVADRRATIAPAVQDAIRLRRGVREISLRLEALAQRQGANPDWTRVVAELAAVLPDSAYLTSFAVDDSVIRLSGEARSIQAILGALDASTVFDSPQLTDPLTRAAGESRSGFGLSVRLAAGLTLPGYAASGSGDS